MISVDVKHPVYLQELCEQGGGPGSRSLSCAFPVPVKPFGLCGRKAPRKTESGTRQNGRAKLANKLFAQFERRVHDDNFTTTLRLLWEQWRCFQTTCRQHWNIPMTLYKMTLHSALCRQYWNISMTLHSVLCRQYWNISTTLYTYNDATLRPLQTWLGIVSASLRAKQQKTVCDIGTTSAHDAVLAEGLLSRFLPLSQYFFFFF